MQQVEIPHAGPGVRTVHRRFVADASIQGIFMQGLYSDCINYKHIEWLWLNIGSSLLQPCQQGETAGMPAQIPSFLCLEYWVLNLEVNVISAFSAASSKIFVGPSHILSISCPDHRVASLSSTHSASTLASTRSSSVIAAPSPVQT